MDHVVWDGITRYTTLSEAAGHARRELADAAKGGEWNVVIRVLDEYPVFINAARPESPSLFAPLHQAAYGGASDLVVKGLLERGAWRTLRTARGERAVDVAQRRGHRALLDVLAPVLRHAVPVEDLAAIQTHFHRVICGRAAEQVANEALRLPELEPLVELDTQAWFAIPGMYGGFKYWLEARGDDWSLVTESWRRLVDGSEQRHRISTRGVVLERDGFFNR